jgi:dihydropteroate synthase
MLADGATFLDIGGYSTRPGAADICPTEEADRVLPVIEAIIKSFPDALISVDTFRASIARQTVESGAAIINDVSGGTLDQAMFETVGFSRRSLCVDAHERHSSNDAIHDCLSKSGNRCDR